MMYGNMMGYMFGQGNGISVGSGMMVFAWLTYLAVLVLVVLAIIALIKYIQKK